jgi:hypothetical protein
MTAYKMEDYTRIVFSGITFALPDTILKTIKQLGLDLGISTIPVEPVQQRADDRHKRNSGKRGRLGNNRRDEQNNWDKQTPFKTTEIEKKEGLDKVYTDIKGCLNKLSEKNYNTIKESLFEHIDNVFAHPDGNDDDKYSKIVTLIFDIACINKTFSEIYSTLYSELIDKLPAFKEYIVSLKSEYLSGFDKIISVDPEVDYSKFCDVTKENDKRKSKSIFFTNLMKNDLMSEDEIIDILIWLKDKIVSATDVEGETFYVEELIEVLFVYIKSIYDELYECSRFETIVAHIEQYAVYKAKEHLGLSSRIIFKYMDMLDIVNKYR